MYRNLPYRPIDDFTMISMTVEYPIVFGYRAAGRVGIFVAVDLAGFQDPHGAAADLAAGNEFVDLSGQTASSLSRMRSRMSAAVRGSTISGSPESAAHSMPMSPS